MKPRFSIVSVVLLLVPVIAMAEEGPESLQSNRIIWESEKPTCFDRTLPLPERLLSVPRFKVGGEISEPEANIAPTSNAEDLKATGERPWSLPFEVVINASGKVELVVSLRGGYPQMEDLVGELYSKWIWKPATVEGQPTCVRYILVHRINYQ
jgi:hypothetical protein